jgi:hypothetical protein
MTRTIPALLLLALTTAPALADDKPVYRLDFELTTTEPGKAPTTTTFSLNLAEERHGEATLGDNIALPSGTATTRQNIGMRVDATFVTRGPALLLDVETELTERAGPSTLHRMETKGAALATPGKKAFVAAIDHDKAHTELSVTPTRL